MNKLHEGMAHELGVVISDDPCRNSKMTYQFFQELDSRARSHLFTAVTSGHFVNLSMAMNKNSKPPISRGKGPRISSPRPKMAMIEGLFEELEQAGVFSWNCTGKASHVVTSSTAYWRAVGQ